MKKIITSQYTNLHQKRFWINVSFEVWVDIPDPNKSQSVDMLKQLAQEKLKERLASIEDANVTINEIGEANFLD